MKKYILAFAAVAAMLASCSQDDHLEIAGNDTANSTPQPITTIYASSENGTRAAVNGNDRTQILWQDGDEMKVFSSGMTASYSLIDGAGTTSGVFENAESSITRIKAIMYPYQEDATCKNNKLSFEIPTVQEGVTGSFDKNAAIMYAIGSSANPQLSLAVNFLKVTIPDDDVVRSVTISSPSTPLTGKMELQDRNVSEVTGKECNYVRLIPANGATHFARGDYYIAVKPGEIVTPTISFIESKNDCALQEKSKTSRQNIQFLGNNNVMPLNVDFSTTRTAVQLWEGGPYFADYNVGATDGYTQSLDDYYAWGGCQHKGNDYWTGEGMLTGDHDTATKLWGPNWRMPTAAELQALLDNCDASWFTLDGGCYFYGKVEPYRHYNVFFPASLYNHGGEVRCYWSSTPDDSESDMAKNLKLSSNEQSMESSLRTKGYYVRAVLAVQ